MKPVICSVEYSDEVFGPIIGEAAQEGGPFLLRLREEWLSGALRFDGPGELMLGAFLDDVLIGVGGVSHDPYAPAPGLGRIRHLYVLKNRRAQGVGRTLLKELLDHARKHFSLLRLSADAPEARRLYESCGFAPVEGHKQTHRLIL